MDPSLTLPFLEKLLQILGEGRKSSTYKYAVLIALIDLCVEHGEPPTTVTTAQLARRIVELYWRQVRPYQPLGHMLRQNSDKSALIPQRIAEFRAGHGELVSPPRGRHPDYDRLLLEVERVLIEQPLPKLQRVGGGEERFLYTCWWDESDWRRSFARYRRGDSSAFDNRIELAPGAAESFRALAILLRPLIQQQWLAMVQTINRLPEAELGEFLFGIDRANLMRLHRPLRELQAGKCFYCEGSLGNGKCAVDHFLPWSRYPDDGLDNLVLAHARCNCDKRHYPADLTFGRRWEERSRARSTELERIAGAARWPRDRIRTFGVVSNHYQALPEGVRVWTGAAGLRRLGAGDLSEVHAFGKGLLLD